MNSYFDSQSVINFAPSGGQPAADTAAVVTLAATVSRQWLIYGIHFSYDGDPTGGQLTITGLDSDTYTLSITSGGAGPIIFQNPLRGDVNTQVVVTLAAGGGSVSGQLNVQARLYPGSNSGDN